MIQYIPIFALPGSVCKADKRDRRKIVPVSTAGRADVEPGRPAADHAAGRLGATRPLACGVGGVSGTTGLETFNFTFKFFDRAAGK